jgi:hypothetical protein
LRASLLQVCVRQGCVLERVAFPYARREYAGCDGIQHVLRTALILLYRCRMRGQRRTGQKQRALGIEHADLDGRRQARCGTKRHHQPSGSQAVQRSGESVFSDGVVDHVHLCPCVACITWDGSDCASKTNTWSQPAALARSTLAGLETTPRTWAPRCFAHAHISCPEPRQRHRSARGCPAHLAGGLEQVLGRDALEQDRASSARLSGSRIRRSAGNKRALAYAPSGPVA